MTVATEQDVVGAYRLLLKREPDAGGLAHYLERVRGGLTVDELIESFVSSDEYHDRVTAERYRDAVPVDLGGYQVVAQQSDPDFGHHLVHWREYEEPVRAALRELLTPGDVCVDIGANIGVMTFLAAAAVGPSGRVLAVEPNPDNVQLLYRGLLLNGYTNVEVLPVAASSRRAVFSLVGRSNTHLEGADATAAQGTFVQSVALDDTLGLLPRLDVVKMDVEGHEPEAFRGFRRNIERHRPSLLLEFNPRCLSGVQGQDPTAFAREILALYPRVRAISHFGDDITFESAEALMVFWERRDREVTAAGQLPAGALHFDLVAKSPQST